MCLQLKGFLKLLPPQFFFCSQDPRSFPEELLPGQPPASTAAQGYSSPDTRACTCSCWTSRSCFSSLPRSLWITTLPSSTLIRSPQRAVTHLNLKRWWQGTTPAQPHSVTSRKPSPPLLWQQLPASLPVSASAPSAAPQPWGELRAEPRAAACAERPPGRGPLIAARLFEGPRQSPRAYLNRPA